MRALPILLSLLAAPALAQGVFVPPVAPSDGGTPMSAAQVRALLPQPAAATPLAEAIGGAVGASDAYMRADAKMPRITRANTFTVADNGVLIGGWTNPLPVAPNIVFTPIAAGASRITCELTATPTTTAFAGRCWQDQAVTVSTTTILSGLNIGPSYAPAGTQVQVVAIPPAT